MLGVPHISTGAMLRENVEKGTPVGKVAKSIIENGDLVGDELVNEMVRSRLGSDDCRKGFLLDGYPRTLVQANAFTEILKEKGLPPPVVVNLRVSYNVLVKRLSARRVCPVCGRNYNVISQPPARDSVCDDDGTFLQQRADDREEAVRERLSIYDAQTAPLVEFYGKAGLLFDIDADKSPDQISGELSRLLQVS
jgi:adenylate kinase